jgi:hypothetical protein
VKPFPTLLAIALAAAFAGCDPDPVEVELLAYDQASDTYTFQAVTLETIEDLGELSGRATSVIGGAAFTYNLGTGIMKWDDAGNPVAFAAVEADGVLVPEDFDSLAMVSTYYGLELSLLFFEKIGMPRGTLVHLDTYYWPRFKTIYADGESEIISDNAYYMYLSQDERAFFVFPFEQFQWIPMSINSGIMTHEFSHAVFDQVVDEPNRALIPNMEPASRNFLYGLNEGWADYIAVARTGDPDFMSHTSPKGVFGIQCNSAGWVELVRDAAIVYHYNVGIDTEARTVPIDEFCPYDIGSFVASTMYGVARQLDGYDHADYDAVPSREAQERVAAWFYRAMEELGQTMALDFELWDLFGLMAALAPSEADRVEYCDTLSERYYIYYAAVEGC